MSEQVASTKKKKRSPSSYMGTRRMNVGRRRRLKELMYIAQRGMCGICGEAMDPKDVSIDHIQHASRGGRNTRDNLRAAHLTCNVARLDKT